MRLSQGDTLVKSHKIVEGYEQKYEVKLVENGYVELENGDYIPIREIERDVKHGITRVIRND